MDDYTTKPIKRKRLLGIVDKWTERIDDWGNKNGDSEQPSTVNHPRKIGISAPLRQSSITNHQSPGAPMNFEMVLDDFEGDRELLVEAMDLFLKSVRNQIGALRQAISDNDADLVKKEAHSIKGGAANLTADNLSRVASELENIGESGTVEAGTVILERLEKEFYRLDAFAQGL